MSKYWNQFEGKSVPLKDLLKWLSDEHTHVTDDEGEPLKGWDFPVVNSMALHRWAVAEAVEDEFEYAVWHSFSISNSDRDFSYVVGGWDDEDSRTHLLMRLNTDDFTGEYKLIKRRKAGPHEDA